MSNDIQIPTPQELRAEIAKRKKPEVDKIINFCVSKMWESRSAERIEVTLQEKVLEVTASDLVSLPIIESVISHFQNKGWDVTYNKSMSQKNEFYPASLLFTPAKASHPSDRLCG